MIINSNFKDYYDYVSSYGIDSNVVYNRNTIHLDSSHIPKSIPQFYNRTEYIINGQLINIYFLILCVGSIYKHFIKVVYDNKIKTFDDKISLMEYISHISQTNINNQLFNISQFLITHEIRSEIKQAYEHLQIQHNSPCLIISEDTYRGDDSRMLTINPCLKMCNLHTFIPAEEVFNSIESCIMSMVNTEQSRLPTFDDITLRDSKGFDEMSFKKLPTKHVNKVKK